MAVSRPMMPNGQRSNSCIFSLPGCGAWSVAMASIAPLDDAFDHRVARRRSARSGGFIL